ncbi:hypothetical protein DSO57_1001001 [Entomophthora muscae]|uniref:Uncharacterized protein n=1 Tax=Entomophthora muscae TaxID=34485 RepID=A0ACC2UJ09_9FUNG|nr:hypothetical protein DSO57_1001001 [Entomophthora muscae]
MHPVIRLLRYIPYNLILNQIISGRWGPATGTLLLVPPNVNFMPADFEAPSPILENENYVNCQCQEFYAEDALMLSQVIYLGLLWLGLIVLLKPGVTIGNFTKKYLKLRWWLIINSMWIWVVIPHYLETASYYPVISVTNYGLNPLWDTSIGSKEQNTAGQTWIEQIHTTQETCLRNLTRAVKTYKAFADRKRVPRKTLEIGDKVYFDSQNVPLHVPRTSLSHQKIKINPPPIQEGRSTKYKVEYIHGHRLHYKTPQYYVKWAGYPPKESTWEPVSNLPNTHRAIKQYLDKRAGKEEGNRREGDDVTSDKLLLTMITEKPQLRDSNPETPRAASPQY